MDSALSLQNDVSARLSSQRVAASAAVSVARKDGHTRLVRLFQDGAAKIRMPRADGDSQEAVLINTAGGLTGGDRLGWTVKVGQHASLTVTTQASEKLYRSASGRAEVHASLSVGVGGRLAWLPQETIMFDRAAFSRRLDVALEAGAEALIAEATIFGRGAMGEKVERGMFRDRWRVSRGGRMIHAEDFVIGPEVDDVLARPAVLGGGTAVATVLLVSDDAEQWLERAREVIGEEGGASVWSVGGTGKLLARLHAGDGYGLRKRLVPLLRLLNGRAGLPKCWSL